MQRFPWNRIATMLKTVMSLRFFTVKGKKDAGRQGMATDIEVDPLNARLQKTSSGCRRGIPFYRNEESKREKSRSRDDALWKWEGGEKSGQINDSITIERDLSVTILAQYGPKSGIERYRVSTLCRILGNIGPAYLSLWQMIDFSRLIERIVS